jgi:hypothetical protein
MGMFDTIYCEKKLPLTKEIKKAFPDTDWSKADFQTKDLDNTMATYSIKKNGTLNFLRVEGETVRVISEEEEKKIRKQKRFCWPYEFVEKSRKYEKCDHTGTVNFYFYREDNDNNTWDLEFTATFVKGKLTDLVLDSAEIIHTAEENAASEKAWKDSLEAHKKHPWTKTKRFLNSVTFSYWSIFWGNKVSRSLYWVSQKIQKLQLWIVRNLA